MRRQANSQTEAFNGLTGDRRDEIEVLIDMEHGQRCQLCRGSNEYVWNGGRPVEPSIRKDLLDLEGMILNRWGQVLSWQPRQGRSGV